MIALVGRPNVGKSSLFNALCGKRQALVQDREGVTRDRRFATVPVEALNGKFVRICDTGGWLPREWREKREDDAILLGIEKQVLEALAQSTLIFLVVDIRAGLSALDEALAKEIRKLGKPWFVLANKADVSGQVYQAHEFHRLGATDVLPISAEHKQGIFDFWERIAPLLPEEAPPPTDKPVRVAIVGRPNVGKSSLLNFLLGEERSVASPISGTTTDPVDASLEKNGQRFVLVDTAGIRRHAKRSDDLENLSVLYAQRALGEADLAFLVVDAADGITSQDSRIASLVEESGCGVIILANKWDLSPQHLKSASADGVKKYREIVEKDWPFLDFAPLVALSVEKGKIYGTAPGSDALDATDPWPLPKSMEDLWALATYILSCREKRVSESELSEVVEEAFAVGPNWAHGLGAFRRVHQVGHRPPQFLAFVKNANEVPEALRRYLKRAVRERFGFRGNPIRWTFRHKGHIHPGQKSKS
jgi:GTPase